MARNPKTAFDTVTGHLGQLTRGELVELADIVAALLSATDDEEGDQVEDLAKDDVKPAAKGHIEEKTINGCGPYLYLRYWQSGKLRSKYIGKKAKQ